MLFTFILLLKWIFAEEICEKFLITHHFIPKNSEDCFFIGEPHLCPNRGTWGCGAFICIAKINGTACRTGFYNLGMIDYKCCVQKNIRYIDFWFTPQKAGQGFDYDWYIEIFNYDIHGNGSNITIEKGESDEKVFQNLYDFIGKLTYISIIIDGYSEENCTTNFYLYINGTKSLLHNTNQLQLYTTESFIGPALNLIFQLNSRNNKQNISSLYAHTIVPTDEEIKWLYSLGPYRSKDTEICYNITIDDCPERPPPPDCNITDNATVVLEEGVPQGYKTATITLSILFGLTLLILIGLIIWLMYLYFMRVNEFRYQPMEIEL